MPSWKKVITSGSSAQFLHVTASGHFSGSTTSTGSFGHIMKGGINWDTAVSTSAATAGFGSTGASILSTPGGFEYTSSTAGTTWNVTHDLNQQYPNVTVYDSDDEVIIPTSIVANTVSSSTITFDSPVNGKAHFSVGSSLSGSATSTGSFGHIITAGHIVPTVSETYDLGSAERPFRDLHISSASIKIYDGDGEVARLQISADYGLEVFKTKDLTALQKSTYTPAQIRSNAAKKSAGALDPETAEYSVVDSDTDSFLSAVYVTDTDGNFIIASQES